ncbi:hypothetical protein SADUNF_Sadunf04G0142500 [Salix dunnii]|uniref:Uncharacterized protein n=1 Tax=Salix dunnii TaxID=1413687 RepID=A0A835N424_9ROSI|nr:hypothetical protein SADUNF_Sadunf04G0142500 [Salix dunnii]
MRASCKELRAIVKDTLPDAFAEKKPWRKGYPPRYSIRNLTGGSEIFEIVVKNGGNGKTEKSKEKKGFLKDTIDVRIHVPKDKDWNLEEKDKKFCGFL